jgi:hypothetical protein
MRRKGYRACAVTLKGRGRAPEHFVMIAVRTQT